MYGVGVGGSYSIGERFRTPRLMVTTAEMRKKARVGRSSMSRTSGVNRGQYLRREVSGVRSPGLFVGVLARSSFFRTSLKL